MNIQKNWKWTSIGWGFLLLGWLCLGFPWEVQAQEEEFADQVDQEIGDEAAAGAGVAAGEPFIRLGVFEFSAMRFNDPHPFEAMTGNDAFQNPFAPPQMSFDYAYRPDGMEDTGVLQPILRALPPFSFEYVWPGLAFGFDVALLYYHTTSAHLDRIVAFQHTGPKSSYPILKMKVHYDFIGPTFHFLSASDEGLDIYVGFGVASIDGAYEGGFRGSAENDFVRTTKTKNFDAIVSFRRVGLDINGETFGFRFALNLISNTPVITDNFFVGQAQTPDASNDVSFQGTLIIAALTWRL